jgi:hypothetical protein
MVQDNQNTLITKNYLKAFKLQQNSTPNLKPSPIVSGIVNLNPKREGFYIDATSTGVNMLTCSQIIETYLTMISITSSDSTSAYVRDTITFVTDDGISHTFALDTSKGNGTIDNQKILYLNGLKLSKGSSITTSLQSEYGSFEVAGFYENIV